jgi:hypothetical protein
MGLFEPDLLVHGSVGLEVVARHKRAQAQNGFGALQTPACAADVHAVFDEVATRFFYNPRGGESDPWRSRDRNGGRAAGR